MSTPLRVPYHRPSIGEEEIDSVTETLRSGWLTTGTKTLQFEREFREYVDAPHALAVNSCTSGLHLVLAALDIGPGDEVITTPLTFCATVNVILHRGATPVLADIGEDGNIDPKSIARRITPRTRAIIPVHFAGLPCDLDAIGQLASQYGLYVIEDCAHAVGARYNGRAIGCGVPPASTAAVFSFYATKNMTTGEGGMITTGDAELAAKLKTLCLHGISKDAWNRYSDRGSWYYEVLEPGFKYNLTDIQSSLGLHQLRKLDGFIERRREIANAYGDMLKDCEELELPADRAHLLHDVRHAWHLYTVRLNLDRLNIDRAEFIAMLQQAGIGTSVHFIPIPLHPAYAEWTSRPGNACPVALALYPRSLSLPLFPSMTDEQVAFVATTVRQLARDHRAARCFAAHI